MVRARQPHLAKNPVRRQVAGAIEGPGVLQHPGRGKAPPDYQAGAHRRRFRHRGPHQNFTGCRPPAPGTPPGLGFHEKLNLTHPQLAGPVKMAPESQILVFGQVDQVGGGEIRLPGLLVKSRSQQPEKD
jgi:hypothetical protein